jgi:hypothetical protein
MGEYYQNIQEGFEQSHLSWREELNPAQKQRFEELNKKDLSKQKES